MQRLFVAVRAYTETIHKKEQKHGRPPSREPRWPDDVVIFDTETTTDPAQCLTFGSCRFCQWSKNGKRLKCVEEILFYDDALPKTDPEGFARLQEYVKCHRAGVVPGYPKDLQFFSRAEFVEKVLFRSGYQGRALVVGFNLPFDLSRVAVDSGKARGRFRGGFTLTLRRYRPKKRGPWLPHPFRARVRIQHVNSKMSFMEFDRPAELDPDDQRPEPGAAPDPRFAFRGRLLDLKTLAFALTDKGYSLERASEAFRVEHPKKKAERHGTITAEYIDYNRRDVLASQQLLEKLREEFDRHPIELDPGRAFSPASIAKAYYRAMGLRPLAEQFKDVPRKILGYAMSAFYGGRAECRIRKAFVPVAHTDFTSMYPTVQSLLGLSRFLRASEVKIVEATKEVRALLARVTHDGCFDPAFWSKLVGFAQVVPNGTILPVRAKYNRAEWNVGVNPLTAEAPLWYAIPDLVASTLLTGKAPEILQAFRLVAKGRQPDLKPIRLRGEVPIDPRKEDVFRAIIENRQRVKRDETLPREERERTQHFLKILANAGSYGIFVEMNRKTTRKDKPASVSVYGREGAFAYTSNAPEEPGTFAFPPIASLVTAAARLMLALLEACVRDAGGTYAFMDTDSMAIVASEKGGLVPCPGGPYRLTGGEPSIRALAFAEVEAIRDRFEALNPYDRSAVPGSILRLEEVNSDEAGRRRELLAYVISAKRYALFTLGPDGEPVIQDYSEHGLGQLLNPIDPESEDREWIRQTWEGLVREALGGPPFAPPWGDRPAVMRTAVTTPSLLDQFEEVNRNKPYARRVKPFNFLISAFVSPIERPPGADTGFHLVAPFSRNPARWERIYWTDLHTGKRFRIRTGRPSSPGIIRVRTHKEILQEFRDHPEAKSAGPGGEPSNARTVGLLGRFPVQALTVVHIGKETNLLEHQEEGILVSDPQEIYWGGGEWEELRRWLSRVPIRELVARSGVSERMLRDLRQGTRRPSAKSLGAIVEALRQMCE